MRIARASRAADRMLALVEAHEHRPSERLAIDHLQSHAERDAVICEVAQHLRVGVRNAHEPSDGTDRQLVEAARRALVDLKRDGRDRIAVRVNRRVAKAAGDQLLKLLREHMLEHLGFGVHAIPGHSELLGEKQLKQPVMAQHLKRDPAALVGQPHAAIGLMLEQPHVRELAQHARHRPRRDAQTRGEIVRRHRRAAASLERVHRLRIVLHGR